MSVPISIRAAVDVLAPAPRPRQASLHPSSSCPRWPDPLTHSGIGLETALQFASEGARVVMADINEAAVTAAAEQVRSRFPTSDAVAVKCDVGKEADIKAMVDAAVQKFGRLDVMVSAVAGLGLGWAVLSL